MRWMSTVGVAAGLLLCTDAIAETATIHRATPDGPGASVGRVTFEDSRYGLIVTPDLRGLEPGLHGAHVHQNPNCGPSRSGGTVTPAGAAGGHYDPAGTGRHAGPYGDGHLGDLPNLTVEADGTATLPVLAPRVKTRDLQGRSLMIHAAPDRYTNAMPGGARGYCGVIE